VLAHMLAVAANREAMILMHEPIDEHGCHDIVAEDVALVFEAVVRRENRRVES
jgi:hypothetical protein